MLSRDWSGGSCYSGQYVRFVERYLGHLDQKEKGLRKHNTFGYIWHIDDLLQSDFKKLFLFHKSNYFADQLYLMFVVFILSAPLQY